MGHTYTQIFDQFRRRYELTGIWGFYECTAPDSRCSIFPYDRTLQDRFSLRYGQKHPLDKWSFLLRIVPPTGPQNWMMDVSRARPALLLFHQRLPTLTAFEKKVTKNGGLPRNIPIGWIPKLELWLLYCYIPILGRRWLSLQYASKATYFQPYQAV